MTTESKNLGECASLQRTSCVILGTHSPLRLLREMGMTGPSLMLLLLTGRERGQKPARRPLQARGARASRYALHLTLLSSRPEASSALTQTRSGSPTRPLPSPSLRARPPPHRAGTAAQASSPPGVGRRKTPPPPPSWNRARRLRQRDSSAEWPLPPAPAQRGFRLAEARGVEPVDAEKPGRARSGR